MSRGVETEERLDPTQAIDPPSARPSPKAGEEAGWGERPLTGVVQAIAERQQEPRWARERRFQSLLAFERIPMPQGTEETWRRTDVQALRLESFLPAEPAPRGFPAGGGASLQDPAVLQGRGGLLIQQDSQVVSSQLAGELAAQGVIFCDLGTALVHHPDLVREHLNGCVSPSESKFVAMNGALGSGGVLLYVPPGLEVSLPLQAIYQIGQAGSGIFPHTVIVAGPGSKVAYFEEYTSPPGVGQAPGSEPALDLIQGPGQALSSAVVEIFLGEGAQLCYLSLQRWGDRVYHFSTQRARVQRDSTLRWIDCTLGGRLSKSFLEGLLLEPGARVEQTGLFFGIRDQHMDFSPLLHHLAPHTTGEVLFRGALKGKARSVFQGLIRVEKEARQTDAFLANHNLILSEKGRADSIPRLEIENNDVRCSHAVTAGRVDQEQVFYLMSRGLTEAEAMQLIVSGFFAQAYPRIPLEEEREKLRAAMEERIEA